MTIRVGFFGNWGFGQAALRALHCDERIEIVYAVTRPRSADPHTGAVTEFCESKGVRCVSSEGDWLAATSTITIAIDLAVVCAFDRKVPKALYQAATYGGMNIHQSFLPAFRGRDPVLSAIVAGAAFTGITFHRLTEEYDAGDVFFQARWPLRDGQTLDSTVKSMGDVVERSLGAVIGLVEAGAAVPQSGEVTQATKKRFDYSWSDTVAEIRKKADT